MAVSLKSIVIFLVKYFILVNGGSRHSTEILQRPNDVIGSQCGKEIRMGCVAKSRQGHQADIPDIEWWYRGNDLNTAKSSKRLLRMDRDGRVKVQVEEFYVVRSTLIIQDSKLVDEGIYQCRASNSASRYDPTANLYKHWRIEEAPVRNIDCPKDTNNNFKTSSISTTTTTHVIPSRSYNSTEFDDVIKAMVTSTIETTTKESTEKTDEKKLVAMTTTPTKINPKIKTKKPKNQNTRRQRSTTPVQGILSPGGGRGAAGNNMHHSLKIHVILEVVCALVLTYLTR